MQYDETDLDFVQRLLEHEGIIYFFEHGEGEHTLVLADAMSKLKPATGYETVPYHLDGQGARRDVEHITDWIPGSSVRPGAYAHTDYDFKKPGCRPDGEISQAFGHKQAAGEHYHQPGAHLDTGRGDAIAAIRREELQAPHQRVAAVGTVRGLFSGCTFKLDGFPRDDQNQEYLVVSAEYRLFDPGFRSGIDTEGETFRIVLGVAPTKLPYRPPRITSRPIMRGPQTATVVGPSGEEIFTDEYARVKVQFHWDREGKKDENSSCFVRVSQTWAGSGWGFIQIPRIGQEVIVDFIEGDPDRPIITGRVYNAGEMPPYGLPGNATQSGWKSNSSKGGGGYNELMFEDKAGSELVNFQAQKDHKLLVKNDRTKLVQHDQSDRIDHDAKHSVGHESRRGRGQQQDGEGRRQPDHRHRVERHRDGGCEPVADRRREPDDRHRRQLDRDDRRQPDADGSHGADRDRRRGARRHRRRLGDEKRRRAADQHDRRGALGDGRRQPEPHDRRG